MCMPACNVHIHVVGVRASPSMTAPISTSSPMFVFTRRWLIPTDPPTVRWATWRHPVVNYLHFRPLTRGTEGRVSGDVFNFFLHNSALRPAWRLLADHNCETSQLLPTSGAHVPVWKQMQQRGVPRHIRVLRNAAVVQADLSPPNAMIWINGTTAIADVTPVEIDKTWRRVFGLFESLYCKVFHCL